MRGPGRDMVRRRGRAELQLRFEASLVVYVPSMVGEEDLHSRTRKPPSQVRESGRDLISLPVCTVPCVWGLGHTPLAVEKGELSGEAGEKKDMMHLQRRETAPVGR